MLKNNCRLFDNKFPVPDFIEDQRNERDRDKKADDVTGWDL